MQINGEWLLCDDGVVRPVIRGEILTNERFWQPAAFLVDTGADRTVFSAATLSKLVLRTANTAPVWCGGMCCFATRFGGKNWIFISAELY
jgi:hypothetical protein